MLACKSKEYRKEDANGENVGDVKECLLMIRTLAHNLTQPLSYTHVISEDRISSAGA